MKLFNAGENFAMISGTSMATPHVAGIAALVKEKFPSFSPAAIHSALAGTAFSVDQSGAPLQAQYPNANNFSDLIGPSSPFDLGAGQVDALPALDPGLIFEAGPLQSVSPLPSSRLSLDHRHQSNFVVAVRVRA